MLRKLPCTFELLRGGVCNELEVFKEYQVLKQSISYCESYCEGVNFKETVTFLLFY